jgi:excisionase family DNA binding protein
MTNEMTHGLIKQSEAASYLGLSEATLERDRWRGGEIPYIRVGPRSIRYDLSQLNEYLERKTVRKEVVDHD